MTNHRQLCKSVAEWLLDQNAIQLVSWELGLDVGVVDAIGITTKTKKHKTPRVVIAEVKRTRSDLLSDLRRKKMHGYEPRATHCYLAATLEAYVPPSKLKKADLRNKSQFDQWILSDLASKGLPTHWGVLIGTPYGDRVYWRCLRSAIKTQTAVTTQTLGALTKKIALSYMYRILSNKSPMTDGSKPTQARKRRQKRRRRNK